MDRFISDNDRGVTWHPAAINQAFALTKYICTLFGGGVVTVSSVIYTLYNNIIYWHRRDGAQIKRPRLGDDVINNYTSRCEHPFLVHLFISPSAPPHTFATRITVCYLLFPCAYYDVDTHKLYLHTYTMRNVRFSHVVSSLPRAPARMWRFSYTTRE